MNKRTVIIVGLSLLVSMLILPLCNAAVTPVEVERMKDVYFVRMRGDHNTQSYLLHYVNLSPQTQEIRLIGGYCLPGDTKVALWTIDSITVAPGDSIDVAKLADYGKILEFSLYMRIQTGPIIIGDWTKLLEGTVVIPPKL